MNWVKKTSMLLTVFIVFLTLFPIGIYGVEGGVVNAYDITDPLYDLARSNINGKAFDESDYPIEINGDMQLIAVNEVGYFNDASAADNYALYLYLYYPRVFSSTQNQYRIRNFDLEVSGNGLDYFEFKNVKLDYINSSSDGRFVKFKYSCKEDLHSIFAGKNERHYRLLDLNIGVDCITDGMPEMTPDGSPAGGSFDLIDDDVKEYTFSGETLYKRVVFNDLSIIELDVNSTVYRTPTSDKGANYQYDIFTAYFAVPNSYIEEYSGGLTGLKCKYEECLSDYTLFTERDEVYNNALTFNSTFYELDEYVDDAPSLFWDYGLIIGGSGNSVHETLSAKHGINVPNKPLTSPFYKLDYSVTEKHEDFPRVFKVDDIDNTYYRFSEQEKNKIAVSERKPYQVYEYNSFDDILTVRSQFQNDRWKQLFSGGFIFPVDEVDVVVEPFHVLDYSEMSGYVHDGNNKELCRNLLINEADISDFDAFCKSAELSEKTVILFRFACRDYYSSEAYYQFPVSSDDFVDKSSLNFVSQFSFFKDFEIIELTFERDSVGYVFPVHSDPIDIFPDITDPETPKDNFDEGIEDVVENIKNTFNNIKINIGNGFTESFKKITAVFSAIAVLVAVLIVIKLFSGLRKKDTFEIVLKNENARSKKEKKRK